MPIDWKSPDAFARLLAAMVAAQDQSFKVDYRRIATIYGQGATYDSIEGRFRIIKREAAALKLEIESGARPEAPVRGASSATSSFTSGNDPTAKKEKTPRKPRTPKKPAIKAEDKVLSGRVNKITSPSRSKKSSANIKSVKEEMATSKFSDIVPVTENDHVEVPLEWDGAPDFDMVFGAGLIEGMEI